MDGLHCPSKAISFAISFCEFDYHSLHSINNFSSIITR